MASENRQRYRRTMDRYQFYAHPRRWAFETPDKPAVIVPSVTGTGADEVISYRELDRRANQAAHLFRKLGLQRGGHVAMLIENHPRFLEVAWAAHNAGLFYTPISWRFRAEEIVFIARDCGARLLVTTVTQANTVAAVRAQVPGLQILVLDGDLPGCLGYPALTADMPGTPIADESRGSDMVYTSGSTGRPKGIRQQLPTGGIDGLSAMFRVYADQLGWGPETTYLMPCPLYHSGPLRFAMAIGGVGGTLVVMPFFDAETSLALVERLAVTNAHWVPTMLVRLLKLPPYVRDRYDLSALRTVVHGVAPCPPEVKRAMIDWLGPILEESYGGTEGNGLTMISSAEWLSHPGSVGRPFLGSVHIIGPDGGELAAGEIGTVYFAGGPRFAYHNNAERTAVAFDAQGRSTLGDMGYVDAEGYLYLTGRRDQMAISGGVNIYPQEAENVLLAHPAVADAAVFGVPDADMGEVLRAAVQPVDPDAAGPALADTLIAHCRASLASIKCPRTLVFTADLPRHDTGKIYTRLLRDAYIASLEKAQ